MVLVSLATVVAFELPFGDAALRQPDQPLGRAEALAAAATVPLALGMLGLYTAAQAFASRFT